MQEQLSILIESHAKGGSGPLSTQASSGNVSFRGSTTATGANSSRSSSRSHSPGLTSSSSASSSATTKITIAPSRHASIVIRNKSTYTERFSGPWTVVALCRQFVADVDSHLKKRKKISNSESHNDGDSSQSGGDEDDPRSIAANMVREVLASGSGDSSYIETIVTVDHQRDRATGVISSLPPRQVLSALLDGFFNSAEYSTDVFSRETFYQSVDRIYGNPASEPCLRSWALCFNLIILFMLGSNNPSQSDEPFVRPIYQSVLNLFSDPVTLLAPSIINIQAMTLLVSLHRSATPSPSRSVRLILSPESSVHKHQVLTKVSLR